MCGQFSIYFELFTNHLWVPDKEVLSANPPCPPPPPPASTVKQYYTTLLYSSSSSGEGSAAAACGVLSCTTTTSINGLPSLLPSLFSIASFLVAAVPQTLTHEIASTGPEAAAAAVLIQQREHVSLTPVRRTHEAISAVGSSSTFLGVRESVWLDGRTDGRAKNPREQTENADESSVEEGGSRVRCFQARFLHPFYSKADSPTGQSGYRGSGLNRSWRPPRLPLKGWLNRSARKTGRVSATNKTPPRPNKQTCFFLHLQLSVLSCEAAKIEWCRDSRDLASVGLAKVSVSGLQLQTFCRHRRLVTARCDCEWAQRRKPRL